MIVAILRFTKGEDTFPLPEHLFAGPGLLCGAGFVVASSSLVLSRPWLPVSVTSGADYVLLPGAAGMVGGLLV